MSKKSCFAILDVKANAFMTPFFHATPGQAIRDFSAAVRKGGSVISDYPDDFTLYHIGIFDDLSGLLEPVNPPAFLSRATEHVQPAEPAPSMGVHANGQDRRT